ncbi:hypothetical protein PROFUN_00059 [Planoprotostelium fungivorum]|uniref:Uncharacterized protein n=1 Tax=Planoprotostelium fungivorum TaxID=1890364 RepID=A0A2P6P0J6_9EUKA|nr:hypothetical protein PROFUN_00059 [Planoprotostelium fungivorum]
MSTSEGSDDIFDDRAKLSRQPPPDEEQEGSDPYFFLSAEETKMAKNDVPTISPRPSSLQHHLLLFGDQGSPVVKQVVKKDKKRKASTEESPHHPDYVPYDPFSRILHKKKQKELQVSPSVLSLGQVSFLILSEDQSKKGRDECKPKEEEKSEGWLYLSEEEEEETQER